MLNNNSNGKIVTRFAPSPTGLLHSGNYRTAVFAYLFARKNAGKFILRIEDSDKARSKKEFEDNIIDSLNWLGLKHDEFFRFSDQLKRYEDALQKLITNEHAYISKETPTEEGQRSEVVRFRNPNEVVTFMDMIRGEISIDTTDLGDFIIGRSPTEPLYHFGVIVDDADEGVTHVIRGEDHISNTPRQILIQRALGITQPTYAHLPLVLGPDRTKLSKRRGAKAITEYRSDGFLAEAVINYLALLGWHPADDREIFSLEELVEEFDLSRIQKGSGIFDETKLRWFNKEHLRRLSDAEYSSRLSNFILDKGENVPEYFDRAISVVRDRAETLADAASSILGDECAFVCGIITPSIDLLISGSNTTSELAAKHLAKVREIFTTIPEDEWSSGRVKEAIFPYATEVGRSSVLWPLRVALSGREKSPDPFTISGIIGKSETLSRIDSALKKF